MSYARPTSITFVRAAKLCVLVVISPTKFLAAQEADNRLLKEQNEGTTPEPGAFVIRRAFFMSALLVVASGILGYLGSLVAGKAGVCATPRLVMWLQVFGACLLLWGTLFIRGWDIQTYSGHTLTERVNQWIYRSLYCAGTAIIVLSVVWASCAMQG